MIWIRRAWPLALLAIVALPACPSDDTSDDAANDSGPNTTPMPTGMAEGTADESAGDDSSVELGCAADVVGETTNGATDPIMQTWGAPCTSNQDCVDIIGDPEAICDFTAVVYELPGGYCTKECELPDVDTRFVHDDPNCSPDGGVTCMGVSGQFERCGIPCTDDAQCNRAGYICRLLPLIGQTEDPRFCLMPDCCQDTCAEG